MSGFSRNFTIQSLTSVVFFGGQPALFRLLCALYALVLLRGDTCITRLYDFDFRGVCLGKVCLDFPNWCLDEPGGGV